MKYAIFLEVDAGEWDYLRVKENGCWTINSPIHLFDSKEDALEECKQYNTATVTEYQYDKDTMHVDPDKRPWTYDCEGNKIVKTDDGEPDYTRKWDGE